MSIVNDIEEELPESEELYEKLSIVIDRGQDPLRIDKFLMRRIEGATRNKIQQAIENELVLVNEKPIKNNYKIKAGDKIIIYDTNTPESSEIIPQNIPLDIVYEDDDLFAGLPAPVFLLLIKEKKDNFCNCGWHSRRSY